MKNISTGTGLCVLGLCLASYPIIDRVMPRAEAGATHVAAVVAAATAQVPPEPTIVWMFVAASDIYAERQERMWSDGRIEFRTVYFSTDSSAQTYCYPYTHDRTTACSSTDWAEIPPPPSGNGFACRADIDGNRIIDGADLGMVLANWGPQTPCQPEATYPCLTLNQPLLK
jgi:hypothetical protein